MNFVRGDTLPFKFSLTHSDGTVIEKSEISTLILTCRKFNKSEYPILFEKDISDFTFEDDYYHCVFNPEDTQELDYGTYNFDIEITLKSGYRKTLKSQFRITEEDTIHKSEVE